jgi:hypothetical protein
MEERGEYRPLTIFIGGHGSGKSELAISFILLLKDAGYSPLRLIDLDIVKPMFRGRTARKFLEEQGIELLASRSAFSDLPMIGPEIGGALAGGSGWQAVDCGGDAQGVRVLRSLSDHFQHKPFDLWYVTNIMRPFNSTREQVLGEVIRLQNVSTLKVTGLISNSHLLGQEDIELIRKGIEITRDVAGELGIPMRFIGVNVECGELADDITHGTPLLVVNRFIGFNIESGADYGDFGI